MSSNIFCISVVQVLVTYWLTYFLARVTHLTIFLKSEELPEASLHQLLLVFYQFLYTEFKMKILFIYRVK